MNSTGTDIGRKILDDRLKRGYTQYTPEIAAYWDVLIDWEKRKEGEGTFFIDTLKKYKVKKILDMACGTGYDSVRLLEEGVSVKSMDGNLFMLTKARINAEDRNLKLNGRICDWTRLGRFYKEKFDSVICLGNSFCHLFDKEDRVDVLRQVFNLLRNENGVFIIDQRNFDKILDKSFSSKHKYVYCGTDFLINLKVNKKDIVTIFYKYGNLKFNLDMYPIRFAELRNLLMEAGFKVKSFGDFSKDFSLHEPDFFQHVCIKNR